MATRVAPLSSGFSFEALRRATYRFLRYLVLLQEVFAEAKAQARAAQARGVFVEG